MFLCSFVLLQVFSIVEFSCIASIPDYRVTCPYYYSDGACSFGIAVGVISFLALMIFLVADALFDNISNARQRKCIVIADLTFSGKINLFECEF